MKKAILAVILLLFAGMFCVSAAGAEKDKDYEKEQLEKSGVYEIADSLDSTTKQILKDIGVDDINSDELFNISFSSFFKGFKDVFNDALSTVLKSFLIISGTIFVAALSGSFSDVFSAEKDNKIFNMCASLFVILAVIVPLGKCITAVGSAVKAASALSVALVPVMCVLLAVGGKSLSAVGFNGMAVAMSQIISTLCSEVFMPVENILLGVGMIAGIDENLPVDKLISSVRKYISLALGIAASVYFSVLGIKSAVGAASDTLGLKAAKLLVGNLVPVIGSAVSDSITTLASYISLTKSVVGSFGIIAVISIFMPVFIQSVLWLACFEISSFLASVFGLTSIEKIFKNVTSAVSVLLIMLLFTELMFVINFAMMTAAGGAS